MPRLLFAAVHTPPDNSPGAIRALRIVEQLSKNDWDIVVLSSNLRSDRVDHALTYRWPQQIEIIPVAFFHPFFAAQKLFLKLRQTSPNTEAPSLDKTNESHRKLSLGTKFRQMLKHQVYRFYYPDIYAPWIKPAIRAALNIHKQNPVDVILTTAGPWATLFVGYHFSRETGVPWVTDYRDPWTISKSEIEALRPARSQTLDRAWQQRFLTQCAVANVVSEETRERYKEWYSVPADKIQVLPIGYDDLSSELEAVDDNVSHSQFVIKYVGTMTMMVLESFLQGLAQWLTQNPARRKIVRLRLVGNITDLHKLQVRQYGLEDIVEYTGNVSREMAWREACTATILLLLWYATDRAYSPGSKVFTYLASGRPILAVVPPGSGKRIVEESGQGIAVSANDVLGIQNALEYLWNIWHSGQLEQRFPINPGYFRQYSQPQVMERLDQSLRRVVKASQEG